MSVALSPLLTCGSSVAVLVPFLVELVGIIIIVMPFIAMPSMIAILSLND